MTPYFQRPLELGCDIVMHSTTKYFGGHSDVLGGLNIVRDAELGERLAGVTAVTGGVAGPFDAYLTLPFYQVTKYPIKFKVRARYNQSLHPPVH